MDARKVVLLEEGAVRREQEEALAAQDPEEPLVASLVEHVVHLGEGSSGEELEAEEERISIAPGLMRSVKSNRGLLWSTQRRRAGMAAGAGVAALALVACVAARSALNAEHGVNVSGHVRAAAVGLVSEQMQPWPMAPGGDPFPSSCVYGSTPLCPARALFKNPEVHEVASQNILRVGGQGLLNEEDREMVRSAVEKSFASIDSAIAKRAPDVAFQLDDVALDEQQKDAVLVSLRLMSDPRVQSLGFDVGMAVRESGSVDPRDLRRAVEERLRPRLEEIGQLRRQLMPEAARAMWASGHPWNITLEQDNIRVMRASEGGVLKDTSSKDQAPVSGLSRKQKVDSVMGGVLEQGRVLVDIIQMCGRMFGKNLALNASDTKIAGAHYFDSADLSCEVSKEKGAAPDFMKAFFCPLKFGSQGIDALRAEPSMSGRKAA